MKGVLLNVGKEWAQVQEMIERTQEARTSCGRCNSSNQELNIIMIIESRDSKSTNKLS